MIPRILLVEDNPSDEKLTLLALRSSGVPSEITVARDGAAALEYLFGTGAFEGRDVTETPTVTLLDLKLPKVDGLEVLRRIREDERTRHVPVIVLTASRQREDIAASYAHGANAYVRKPLDFAEFVETTKTLCRFWLVMNEPPFTRRST